MIVIPFKPEHLEQLSVRECYAPGECPKTVMTTAFTFVDKGEVIAIFGGFPFVPGVIHFWGLVSDLVKKNPVAFHKKALEVIHWYEENEKPRRMQLDVREGYQEGRRWAEALGFTLEGLMPGWATDGAAHYLYGRVC